MSKYTKSTAIFSPCRTWRYTLERWWANLPVTAFAYVNFISLNPSTATESEDDPTIRRCVAFAKAWGYPGLIVTNIFALRSTDPKALRKLDDPIGPENNSEILRVARGAAVVVAAWGVWGQMDKRGEDVVSMLQRECINIECLGKTKDGHPRHPLYLKASTMLMPFVEVTK